MTLQNYIKQLSGTQRIHSPRDQTTGGSHFQKKKSNGLSELPRGQNDAAQKMRGQAPGEMIDEFDFRSKSPPLKANENPREAAPWNPYSSAKTSVKNGGGGID